MQVHFEDFHSSTKAKPKQKLRKGVPKNIDINPVSGVRNLEFPSHSKEPPSRSHLEELKKIRGSRVDICATETNKLVVRLDALLQDMPGDPARRREHERGVVDWVDKDLVKLCPACSRSFNLLRNKHHCRLCGCVLCQQCSQWVHWHLCRKLTDPKNFNEEVQPDTTNFSSPFVSFDQRS